MAFIQLYPNSPDSIRARQFLTRVFGLSPQTLPLSPDELQLAFLAFFETITCSESKNILSNEAIEVVEKITSHLPHKRLKGHFSSTEGENLLLPPEEIDLARALLLSQLGPDKGEEIRSIEALSDLMALQILLRLPKEATLEEKVHALNTFIFFEMGFRFPPHATYAKEIDLYTFLPSVLDSRRGVCLGISILYTTLAQRIGLPLEMVTPPGHIYIRAPKKEGHINIETTARGIDLPDEIYLSLECKSLPVRNIKEVIGMAHFNEAALYWLKDPERAIASYKKTLLYIPDDPLTEELMAYCYFLKDDADEGKRLLTKAQGHPPSHLLSGNPLMEDMLYERGDKEGLACCFMEVDETRASLLKKQEALSSYLEKRPNFQSGWHFLAVCQLQLMRLKDALFSLEKLASLGTLDAETAYFLSSLHAERRNFPKAWSYLETAEAICQKEDHFPKVLRELRLRLSEEYPK